MASNGFDGARRADEVDAEDAPVARVDGEPRSDDPPPPSFGAILGVGRNMPIRRDPAHGHKQRCVVRSRDLEGNAEAGRQPGLELRLPTGAHVDRTAAGGRQCAGARALPEVGHAPVAGGRVGKRERLGRGRWSVASGFSTGWARCQPPGCAGRPSRPRHSSLGFRHGNPRELAPLIVLQRKRSGCPGVTGPVPRPVSMSCRGMWRPVRGCQGCATNALVDGETFRLTKQPVDALPTECISPTGGDRPPRRPPRCRRDPTTAPGTGARRSLPSQGSRSACPEPRCPRCPAGPPAAA